MTRWIIAGSIIQSNSKTILHEKGRWVADNRNFGGAATNSVREGQALLRISAIPGMVKQGEDFQRLYQLAEALLTAEVPGKRPKTVLEERILDAQFTNVHHTPGFRGTALLNQRGQAIGLFFPGFHAGAHQMCFATLARTTSTCSRVTISWHS